MRGHAPLQSDVSAKSQPDGSFQRLLDGPLVSFIPSDLQRHSAGHQRSPFGAGHYRTPELANSGDPQAQFRLGMEYATGQAVPLNMAQALAWYRKAADKGVGEAEYNLAVAYHNGLGVTKDEAESLRWYLRAAEHGIPDAQFAVARAYYTGQGVPQDRSRAIEWYRKAETKASYQTAELTLGDLYATGQGTAKDLGEAMRWYRKAAEGGSLVAECRLAAGYLLGRASHPIPHRPPYGFGRRQRRAWSLPSRSWAACTNRARRGAGLCRSVLLDIAGRQPGDAPSKRNELAERRDTLGSHVTEAAVGQAQERVRKWVEDHSGKTVASK